MNEGTYTLLSTLIWCGMLVVPVITSGCATQSIKDDDKKLTIYMDGDRLAGYKCDGCTAIPDIKIEQVSK